MTEGRMSHHQRHYWHPQRQWDRWFTETLNKAPRMPYPLPGEREKGWDIYRILEEIERLRPIISAERKEWFERRRAEMPPEVKAWLAEAPESPLRNGQRASTKAASPQRQRLSHLTPTEKHARKLMLTRESNARKRAERKALGLPYK